MAQDSKDENIVDEQKTIDTSKENIEVESANETTNKSTKITVGNLEININHSAFQFDYLELLEQLYVVKEDETLTEEEKQRRIQEIMNRYVG